MSLIVFVVLVTILLFLRKRLINSKNAHTKEYLIELAIRILFIIQGIWLIVIEKDLKIGITLLTFYFLFAELTILFELILKKINKK